MRSVYRGLRRETKSDFHPGKPVHESDAGRNFVRAVSWAGTKRTKFWVGLSMFRNTLEVFGDP